MKKTYLALLAVFAVAVVALAQSQFNPQPVDYRYILKWDDPNPPGTVASWNIYVTNTVTRRLLTSRTNSLDCGTLLGSLPATSFGIYVAPVSLTGAEGDLSTNIFLAWPGGTGKLRGAANLRAVKP